jgi:hypothetical protein
VPVPAGTTIHIFVADDSTGGGSLALSVSKAPVDATPPVSVRAAVSTGDPTPIGGGFSQFFSTTALSKTDVVFTATSRGIFLNDGLATTPVAMAGDASPVGGTWASFGRPVAGGTGVAFFATISGGTADRGIFFHDGGTTSALVLRGDLAPDGGTFGTIVNGIAISPGGTVVAFIADTSMTPQESIWIVGTGGGLLGPFLSEGDPSPCGGTVQALTGAAPVISINDMGAMAVFYRGANDGVLLGPGSWLAVACQGAPTPLGGTYRTFARYARISNAPWPPRVTFRSTVLLAGPDPHAVFSSSPGGVFVVAAEGDSAVPGATITSYASTNVSDISATGDVVFTARTSLGGDAVIRRDVATGTRTVLLRAGDPCPLGGTFVDVDNWVDIDENGAPVVRGVCTGGTGVFKIPAGGGAPTTVAQNTDPTPAGAGFEPQFPTRHVGSVAFLGSRPGIYQVHCDPVTCATPTLVAAPLMPAPGFPGEVIASIDTEFVTGQGKLVAFSATTQGPARHAGLFAVRSGVPELVIEDGSTIIGTTTVISASGDFLSAVSASASADKRGIADVASIFDPSDVNSPTIAVYLVRNGVVTEVAREGQASPDGGTYSDFGAPLVKGSKVYFRADTTVHTGCLVVAAGSTHTILGCQDDPVDPPAGYTLNLLESEVPGLASRGPVVRGQLFGPTSTECLLQASTSGLGAIACAGDPLPYGSTVNDFNGFKIAASRRRVVSFVNDAGFVNTGLFMFSSRARTRIATNDQPTPAGGVYSMFDPRPSIASKTVFFVGDVVGGTTHQAVFVAILKK